MLHGLRLVSALAAFLSFFVTASAPATAAKRLAFVVGIDRYDNLTGEQQLKRAVADARAMSATLKELQFEVVDGENLRREDFLIAWQRFLGLVSPGDTAAVFFAGHGIELRGANYLMPRDVPTAAKGELVLRGAGLPLSDILDQLDERKPSTSLVILDACRNNPFSVSGRSIGGLRGLARVDERPGTLILYSAGIGQVALDHVPGEPRATNSVFTHALAPLLKTPGLDLLDIARQTQRRVDALARRASHTQTPAFYSQLLTDVYLAGPPPKIDPEAVRRQTEAEFARRIAAEKIRLEAEIRAKLEAERTAAVETAPRPSRSAPTTGPSAVPTTTSRADRKTETRTETKDAVAVHVGIFEAPRDFTARSRYRHDVAFAATMRCSEREGLATVTTSEREPYRWIDIHPGSGMESREYPEFCLVLTYRSQERCKRIPFLKSKDGWVPPSPLQIDASDFEALPVCPPPPPYGVSIRLDVEPDDKPIDVSMLHSTATGGGLAIMGKGLRRSASGYEVNLTRDEATRLLKTPLYQRLNHNPGAFQLTALDLDADRRTIQVVVKPRFITLENVKFRMVKGAKGSEENTNLCSLQLVVPKDRRIGGNWSAVTGNGLRLQIAPGTGSQYQLAPGSGVTVAQLLVASGDGLPPLKLAPPDGNDWSPRCRLKDEEFTVTIEELRKGEVLRNVEPR